jgi:hypothetical protein
MSKVIFNLQFHGQNDFAGGSKGDRDIAGKIPND